MPRRAAPSLALLTLPLLLLACGRTPAATEADPYAGADHPWSFRAPGGQVAPLFLTPGWNTLQYETPTFMTNGWGPIEKNRSNGEQAAGDGRPLTLNGVVYSQGFGTHALSQLSFDLQGTYRAQCTRFTTDVGVDDEVGGRGSVQFRVYLDGVKAYDSGVMTGASATKKIDLNLTGKRNLVLEVTDAGDGKSYDHADWANPRVLCGAVPSGTPGSLDPGFRRIQTEARPLAAAMQPDGKLLTFGAGTTPDLGPDVPSYTPDFFVVRHNPDGSRDTTFGQNGVRVVTAGVANTVRRIVVQPDGKIVAAGLSTFPSRPAETTYVTLLRLLPNGQPDPSFGRPGPINAPGLLFTQEVQDVSDLAVQADGRVVVVEGVRGANTFRVTRFGASGDLDASFGQGGRVTVPFPPPADTVSATVAATTVEVQRDGRIVAGGTQHINQSSYAYGQDVFARLLPDGRLDPSFDGDGRASGLSDRFPALRMDDLLVQPDGRILAAAVDHRNGCRLERLSAAGATDTTFTGNFGEGSLFAVSRMRLALQADGKLLTAGCATINSVGEFVNRVLTRTLPSGEADPTFGGLAGTVIVEDNRSVLVQPNGGIVVGLNPVVRLFP